MVVWGLVPANVAVKPGGFRCKVGKVGNPIKDFCFAEATVNDGGLAEHVVGVLVNAAEGVGGWAGVQNRGSRGERDVARGKDRVSVQNSCTFSIFVDEGNAKETKNGFSVQVCPRNAFVHV